LFGCDGDKEQTPMKFKPTTLALVAIAILLGGVVYFTETRRSSSPEATEGAGGSIFEFEESQVQSFTVETPEQTLSFAKDDAGQWQMQQPEPGLASDASVAYLLNLLATAESDRPLTVPAANVSEFGLDEPAATINVVLDNQETHQLILGSANFDNSAIYAQADPETTAEETTEEAELTVLLVSPDFENAVNRPLEEWRSQPESESPLDAPTPDSPTPNSPEASERTPEEPEVSPPASSPEASEPEAGLTPNASPEPVEGN
jgi:hypothetical protein